MKKIDIIEKYADVNGVSKKIATDVVEGVINIIKDGLIEDKEVDIYGFVKMSVVHKEATTARSPKTGETVDVPEKDAPKAKFSSAFKRELNA